MKFIKMISSSKGLTLIEVLVSLTILSIILLGIMNFFSQAYSYTNLNQKKTAGINVARNALSYMEQSAGEDSFISIQNLINNNPDTTGHLLVCNNQYKILWNNATDAACSPIRINNVDYEVVVTPTINEEYSNFLIPIEVTVTWNVRNNPYSTSVEGAIKSEDLR